MKSEPFSQLRNLLLIAKKHEIFFHTDAAQSVGKTEMDVKDLHVDLLSIAGHKLYAPKGIGALYVKNGILLEKLIYGADHEQNMRAGTENVIEIAGLGKPVKLPVTILKKIFHITKKQGIICMNYLKNHCLR